MLHRIFYSEESAPRANTLQHPLYGPVYGLASSNVGLIGFNIKDDGLPPTTEPAHDHVGCQQACDICPLLRTWRCVAEHTAGPGEDAENITCDRPLAPCFTFFTQSPAMKRLLKEVACSSREAYEPGLKCVTACGKRSTAESSTPAPLKPGLAQCDVASDARHYLFVAHRQQLRRPIEIGCYNRPLFVPVFVLQEVQ